MSRLFLEYFRCPSQYANIAHVGKPMPSSGFFRFTPDLICYGKLSSGEVQANASHSLEDVSPSLRVEDNTFYLPFDLDEVVDNFRLERYCSPGGSPVRSSVARSVGRKTYYAMRPLLPTSVRKHLQRMALRGWDQTPFPGWPIDRSVDLLFEEIMKMALRANPGQRIPFIWFWPEGFSSCAIMTHDVETVAGRDFCTTLMDLDDSFSIKASFQVIPEHRYEVSEGFLRTLRERGFEVNVHDYNHDGDLFSDREQFLQRVARINAYGKKFHSVGYRSAVLYRNINWYDAFDYAYDMSVPNVGHLDPQPGGCCTTKPYFIGKMLEIPVVATQDYTLFNILGQFSTDLWEYQIKTVLEHNDLISFIVHPDYLLDKQARYVYAQLLALLAQLRSQSKLWIPLPRELNAWWRNRNEMRLVMQDGAWRIEGPAKERARIAYASLEGDRLTYTFGETAELQTLPGAFSDSLSGSAMRADSPRS